MFNATRARQLLTGLVLLGGVGISSIAAARFVPMAISQFTIAKYSITSGQGTSATVKVSPSAGVQVVKFTSSNPAVASVPAGIPIQPGSSQATVPIIAGSTGGCVYVTATIGTDSWPRDMIVHPASSASTLRLTVPDQILVLGATYTGKASATGVLSGIPISFTSSDPNILTVPASSETVGGVASFSMATKREGCVTVTATMRSQTVKKVVRVVDIGG